MCSFSLRNGVDSGKSVSTVTNFAIDTTGLLTTALPIMPPHSTTMTAMRETLNPILVAHTLCGKRSSCLLALGNKSAVIAFDMRH